MPHIEELFLSTCRVREASTTSPPWQHSGKPAGPLLRSCSCVRVWGIEVNNHLKDCRSLAEGSWRELKVAGLSEGRGN
jgi:hypothetical protein